LDPGRSKRFFSSPKHPDQLRGPPIFPFNGYRGFFGAKWLSHEVDHSPQSHAEVKNVWSHTSAPPVCLHGMDRDSVTLKILLRWASSMHGGEKCMKGFGGET